MKIHHGGRFTDLPSRKYVDGEVAFVDLIDIEQCKINILDIVMYQSLGYEEKMFYHYKTPLKSLDIGLRFLASDSDIDEMLKYVDKHRIIYVYIENDKSVADPTLNVDEVEPSKILGHKNNKAEPSKTLGHQNDEGEDEVVADEGNYDEHENEDGGEGEDYKADYGSESEEDFEVKGENADPMQPKLNMTETDLEVLDFDLFESDVDDAKESDRRKGLGKLKKESGYST
ncbi:hypothetical protein Tco_1256023 [Tanacetum coccineum]